MEILGIGVPELVFILLIALIVLGPRDMQKAGKTVGRWLRNIVTSQTWQDIRAASRKLSTLPNELIREANLDDLDRQIKGYHSDDKATAPQNDYGAWGSGEENSMQPTDKNTIAPPASTQSQTTNVDKKVASVKEASASPTTNTDKTTPKNKANA